MAESGTVQALRPTIQAYVLQLAVTDTASFLKTVRVGELADEAPGDPALYELPCADSITLMTEDNDPMDPRRYGNVRNR
jgi:hypothetical protein